MVANWVLQTLLILLAYLASVTFGPTWTDGLVVPNWIVAMTLAYALAGMIPYALFWMVLGGIVLEFTLPLPPPFLLLVLTALTALLLWYRQRAHEHISYLALLALGSGAGLLWSLGEALIMTGDVTLVIVASGLVTTGAIFVCYAFIRYVTRRFRLRSQDSTLNI